MKKQRKFYGNFQLHRKIVCIMKLTILFSFVFVISAGAVGYSQSAKLSLKLSNQSLVDALKQIEDQSEFYFYYNNNDIVGIRGISVNIQDAGIEKVLDELLLDTGLNYKMIDRYIVIKPVNEAAQTNMSAQQGKVAGVVKDAAGMPLPGVTVAIKGTNTGTITQSDGSFSLAGIPKDAILVFSFVGMRNQEVPVSGKSLINVSMEEETIGIEEVVAIGYGTVKKSDLTGSVTKVKTQQFETQQAANLLQYLTGTVAGVIVNNATSASESSEIEVRGPTSLSANNSPLIVLDGVIFNGNITDINPNDIESIDILKDASSAAVFGSRSASGVLIINTKRGSEKKLTINISAQLGLTGTTNEIRPYGPDGYIQLRQDFLRRQNPSSPEAYFDNPNSLPEGISLEAWQNYDTTVNPDPQDAWMTRLKLQDIEKRNLLDGRTFDWYEYAMRTGIRQNYDVSLSGGTSALKYYWSAGYTDNKNYIIGDDYQIVRSRLNTDAQLTNYLKVGMNAHFSSKDESNVAVNLNDVAIQSPYGQLYDDNGELTWYPHGYSGITNPFMNYFSYDKYNKTQNLFANIYGELILPFGFSFKTSFINRFDWTKNFYFNPSNTPEGNKTGGYARRINSSLYEWQIDNILTWKKKFGIHDFNVTLLYNAEKKQTWKDQIENIGFLTSEALSYHQLKAGSSPTVENEDTYSTGTATMGRLNYVLMDKYFMTLTYRRDGYSAFGQLNPYANFPSAALAWNIKKENFFHADWISNLKLRASYGVNGNRDIGVYEALAKLGTTKYLSGNTEVSGIYSSTMANAGLRWEKTTALNGGLDFAFLNGRISGSIDLYKTKTTDLLLDRTLPAIIGYKSVMSNMGRLDNKGLEFSLDIRNYSTKSFSWSSSLLFSFNRNKIVHLYGEMIDVVDANGNVVGKKEADDKTNGWFIGESIDRTWDYKALGIYQLGEENAATSFGKAPGDVKLYDPDGNGVSTPEDKEFIGYKKPRYHIGFRNDVTFFKNFSLSCFIRAELGSISPNSLLVHRSQMEDRQNAWNRPYWTTINSINTHTRLNTVDTPAFNLYESTSFVRLQDASLSYTIPHRIIDTIRIQRCRVYISGRNIYTISNWSGWDPESGNTPMPRVYTFGFDLTL